MALTRTQQEQKLTELDAKLTKNDEDIQESIRITRYFTIIVAVTLVGIFVTVVIGLGGLYISAFDKSIESQLETPEMRDLKKDIKNMGSQIEDYKIQREILRSKYPWIKEIN